MIRNRIGRHMNDLLKDKLDHTFFKNHIRRVFHYDCHYDDEWVERTNNGEEMPIRQYVTIFIKNIKEPCYEHFQESDEAKLVLELLEGIFNTKFKIYGSGTVNDITIFFSTNQAVRSILDMDDEDFELWRRLQ